MSLSSLLSLIPLRGGIFGASRSGEPVCLTSGEGDEFKKGWQADPDGLPPKRAQLPASIS